jgi:Skp family chaperone for outer membrane proteins
MSNRDAMPLLRVFALVFLLLSISAEGVAQSKAEEPLVVAVVDVQRILRDAAASNSIRDAINEARVQFEAEIESEGKALKQEEEQLRRQQSILAPEAFDEKRRDLERRYADLRRRSQEAGSRLARARNEALESLRKEMAVVLTSLMEERGITMTLARKNVLVYDERLNITEAVLKQLDARLPRIEVVIEQAGQ